MQHGLIEYAIQKNLEAKDIVYDANLEEWVLSYLARIYDDWKGLLESIEWKASTAYKHFKEYITGMLRLRGKYLHPKIQAAKTLKASVISDMEEAEDPPSSKGAKSKTKPKTRARAKKDVTDTESEAQAPPVKKQKLDVPDQAPSVTFASKSPGRAHQYQSEVEFNVNQAFADLRRIAGNIRSRKWEIAELHKQWSELHAKLKPELDDPTHDLQ